MPTSQKRRFVILLHTLPATSPRATHFDLMLEQNDHLATWELLTEPQPSTTTTVQQLANHRKHYLTFEGQLSADQGEVKQWDQGTYQLLSHTPQQLIALLCGERLQAEICLTCLTKETDFAKTNSTKMQMQHINQPQPWQLKISPPPKQPTTSEKS